MWPGQSLRARLTIALLLVGLIPLAIFAPLVGTLVDQDAAGRETRERSAQASYVADHVAGRLDHVHRASAAVARHLAVLGPGPSRWQEALEKSEDLYPLRVRLVAFSADSQTLASSDGSLVPPDALPQLRDVLASHRSSWELSWDSVTATSALLIYSPIVQDDGTLLGVLRTSADVASLVGETGILSTRGRGRAIVVEANGRVILHPDPAIMQARPVVAVLPRAGRGGPPGDDSRTTNAIDGMSPVPGTDWIAIVDSLDEGGPGSTTPWLGFAAAALLATILAALVAILLAGSLTRPLAALTRAARALMGGDTAAPLPREPGQPAEVNDLVAAFAAMRAQLAGAHDELRASEERYRRLAEHVPDMMTRYELQPTLAFSYVSPSATDLTGYAPADFYADPNLGYLMIHPDDRPKLETVAAALADGRVPPDHQVLRCMHKDGHTVWVEQHMTPVLEGNRLVAVEGITRDVTERVMLAQAVERERALLSAILTSMRDGVVLFDQARTLMYSNAYASQLLGVDLGTLIGHPPRAVFEAFRVRLRNPELSLQWWRAAVSELASSPTFEVELITPSNAYLLVQLLPVTQADESEHGMAVILRDVTDMKRLVRMEERERIAMDLHDGVIQRLYALSLELGAQARDQQRVASTRSTAAQDTENVTMALRGAIRSINEAIEDIRSQVVSLQPVEGDLHAQLERLLEVVRAGTPVKTELTVDREAGRLIGSDAVVQVVFLVWEAASNALRHANAATLSVACRQIGQHIVVTIRDDGIGFDADAQTQGTGRGLSNMTRRARAIGADLSIDSRPGSGTEIRLELPIAGGPPA